MKIRLMAALLMATLSAVWLFGQASFPLESVSVQGSVLSSHVIEQIAGLRLNAPIDKAGLEAACKRLEQSGIFSSVAYHYDTGPKHGYALTLNLTDQPARAAAVIDIPGVGEDEVWTWLGSEYPNFVRRVPEVDQAQQFLAHEIERHLGPSLAGQHVVARFESDLATRSQVVVFQPETLLRIASLTFTGVQEFRSEDLAAMMQKQMGDSGFSERQFRMYLEGVVRQAYEEHGMYRMTFVKVTAEKSGPLAEAVTTEISEGPKFTLGDVQLVGEDLPVDAMLKAAAFKRGKLANWRDIQQGIFALEPPVKRLGYYAAVAKPERILHDEQKQLDLRISIIRGPLYHFGQVSFTGLPPDAEARAAQAWSMKPGDPYNYAYSSEFVQEFAKQMNLGRYKVRTQSHRGTGDHVMDETVIFEPK